MTEPPTPAEVSTTEFCLFLNGELFNTFRICLLSYNRKYQSNLV